MTSTAAHYTSSDLLTGKRMFTHTSSSCDRHSGLWHPCGALLHLHLHLNLHLHLHQHSSIPLRQHTVTLDHPLPAMESSTQPRLATHTVTPRMNIGRRRSLSPAQKSHLLKLLIILKDIKHACLFLNQAHLNTLRLPKYPECIKPNLDLGTIEQKLRRNRYTAIEDVTNDFRRIVENARQQWGDVHPVTESSQRLLHTVETIVKHLSRTTLVS